MKLRKLAEVSKDPQMPTTRTLERLFNKNPRPEFCHRKKRIKHIDIASLEWEKYLIDFKISRKKRPSIVRKPPKKEIPKKPVVKAKEPTSTEQIKKATLKEELRGKKIKNNTSLLKLKKQEGLLVSTALAEFLFMSFLDKAATDLLRITKIIARRVDNMVVAQDADGILKLFDREVAVALKEIKKQQQKDVELWIEEHGGLIED